MEKILAKWGQWKTEFDTKNALGEIIVFDAHGVKCPTPQVRQSLTDAGFDAKLCRDLSSSGALRRAVRELRRSKVVGEIEDTEDRLVFQFSRADKKELSESSAWATVGVSHQILSYEGEGRVVLDKESGDLDGDNRELVATVAALLDQAHATRKTTDVTSIANRLFRTNADLFQLKRTGGAYFVPIQHAGVVDAVQKFLKGVGVELTRYPIAKGQMTGDMTVRDTIRDGLAALIEDHAKAIGRFSEATREGTAKKVLDQINLSKFKIDAYVSYLGQETVALKAKADEAERLWEQAVEGLFKTEDQEQGTEELVGATG